MLSAKANFEKSQLDYKRYIALFDTKDVSEFEYENIRLKRDIAKSNYMSAKAGYNAAKKQFDDTVVKAPFSGFISKRFVDIGDMVAMNVRIAKLINIDFLKLIVEVSDIDIPKISKGNIAKIYLDAYPGEEFVGKVIAISPEANDNTKTFPVEIMLKNTDDFKIKPGMIAKGKIITGKSEKTYLLPQEVVYEKEGKYYIFIQNENTAKMNYVKIGKTIQNKVEIIEGINKGDNIITNGSAYLEEGKIIEVRN